LHLGFRGPQQSNDIGAGVDVSESSDAVDIRDAHWLGGLMSAIGIEIKIYHSLGSGDARSIRSADRQWVVKDTHIQAGEQPAVFEWIN
ncbi:MAG: hypothetical protein ACKN82_05485, partial [Pirellula sp.]